jgi:hypothetical protein
MQATTTRLKITVTTPTGPLERRGLAVADRRRLGSLVTPPRSCAGSQASESDLRLYHPASGTRVDEFLRAILLCEFHIARPERD